VSVDFSTFNTSTRSAVKLVPEISELLSNLFVIVTFVFAVYVVLLAMFFKRLERIRARRLRTIRATADRIHLFAHRIGLVFARILLIVTGMPLLLHKGGLVMREFLPIVALLAVAYGIPRLIGWVIAALFE